MAMMQYERRWNRAACALLLLAVAPLTASLTKPPSAASPAMRYDHLRKAFNATLSGRFPFSVANAAPAADPADVRRFFSEFGPSLQPLQHEIDRKATRSSRAASTALNRLIAVRAALSPMLDGINAPLTYRVKVDFSPNEPLALGQDQVAAFSLGTPENSATDSGPDAFIWRNGQPISATLRWANLAPALPAGTMASDRRCAPRPGGAIARFDSEGEWALLRLLRRYAPDPGEGAGDGPAGTPIAFEVPLCKNLQATAGGDAVRDKARVFMRLELFAAIRRPGRPDRWVRVTLPSFPDSLPTLN